MFHCVPDSYSLPDHVVFQFKGKTIIFLYLSGNDRANRQSYTENSECSSPLPPFPTCTFSAGVRITCSQNVIQSLVERKITNAERVNAHQVERSCKFGGTEAMLLQEQRGDSDCWVIYKDIKNERIWEQCCVGWSNFTMTCKVCSNKL